MTTYTLVNGVQYRPKYDWQEQSPFLTICDFVDQTTGKTYREMNEEIKHSIPVGSLVELEDGVRLFVAEHNRDCDGTPLYSLTPYDAEQEAAYIKIGIKQHVNGIPEDCLVVIRAAS